MDFQLSTDYLALCVAIEELARVDSSVAVTLEAGVSLGAMPIYRYGTEEQKRRWLPALVSGAALAGFGLTEPGFGSDAISAFSVPAGTPGFSVGPGYSKVGWCASDTHPLHLDDVRVPAGNLLGQRGRGFGQFLHTLDEGRIAIAAMATGLAQGCVDESLAYAKQRHAFGQPIGDFQAIAFKLADMETRAHTARLAWYDAAARLVAGQDFKRYAAMAKLYASEIAVTNAREATQIHGGYGFMNEYPVARFWRDAKVLEIGEGTSEVQRMIISRDLGL